MKKVTIAALMAALLITSACISWCGMRSGVVTRELDTSQLQDVIWAIPPQYADLDYTFDHLVYYGDFSSGHAKVRLENGTYIFINKSGENAFPGIFALSDRNLDRNFTRQLPIMQDASGVQFILNITGREILPPEHPIFEPVGMSTAGVDISEHENHMADPRFIISLVQQFQSTPDRRKARSSRNKFGIINRFDQWVVPPIYDDINLRSGPFEADVQIGRSRRMLLTDDFEYVEIQARGVIIDPFVEGFALTTRTHDEFTTHHNFIDLEGKMLLSEDIPVQRFGGIRPSISEGMISYQQNGLFGFMSLDGEVVVEPQYHSAGMFSEGLAYVERRQGRGGYINSNGDIAVSFRRSGYGGQFKNGMAAFAVSRMGGVKEGVIDSNGRWVVRPRYENVFYLAEYNIWKLRNERRGKEVIDMFFIDLDVTIKGYEMVGVVSSTAFTGRRGLGAFFIDVSGAQAVRYRFRSVGRQSEGLIPVQRGSLWGYIDISGNLIHDFQFDVARPFSEGLAAVRVDGKWGYIANPLVYSSWEPDEIERARSLGIVPATGMDDGMLSGEFALLLEQAFGFEEGMLRPALADESDVLTRGTAAILISNAAIERGKYHRYFLPDSDDRGEISNDARFQIGFVIQSGVMWLQDYRFNENYEICRDEAYSVLLRIYEYLLE